MPNDIAEKGIYAPSYYRSFKCIADNCRHSCCIDWEICIDDATYEKYKRIGGIIDTVKESEDGPCFALTEDGRCPHLNESGLCNIILLHGEDCLSEICQNHPRFFNYINGGRIEAGLGIVCEEACRLILENEVPFSLEKTEELDDDDICADEGEYDPIPQRDYIIGLIEAQVGFRHKVARLMEEFGISESYSPCEWVERFRTLEILDEGWRAALDSLSDGAFCFTEENEEKYGKYYERLLTYFVYRHVSTAENQYDLRARLAFSLLSVAMIRALFEVDIDNAAAVSESGVPERLIDMARRYSAEIEYSEDNTAELIFAFE